VAALGALIMTAIISGYRVSVARDALYPGHADPAFTYGAAQNISAGRGPNIDYVWHFLVPGTKLHHYAFDYWLPLPSQLMALVLDHGRPNLPAVLELNIALVVLMCAGAYALARAVSDVPWVPAVCAVAALVQPVVSAYVLQAESSVYLGAFALPAMAAAVYARRWIWLWPVAGAFAGLAAMSRSEGLLLCIVMGVAALVWHERSRFYIRAGLLFAGYLVVSAKYLLTNLSHFGSPVPPAATSFPFITSYENLFAPHVDHSLHALLGGGIKQFFLLRLNAINLQVTTGFTSLTPFVSLLVLLLVGGAVFGGYHSRQPGRQPLLDLPVLRSDWLVPGGFVVVAFLFDALVAPVVAGAGAVVKLMVTAVPILVVAAVVQLGRLKLHTVLTALCCLVLICYPLLTLAHNSQATVRHNNQVGRSVATLIPSLRQEAACLGRPVVLMTRQPWEDNQATGVRTVQIPNGSLADILAIAQQYGVTDIENPAVRLNAPTLAKALADDGPLTTSAAFGARQIYRVKATTADAHC
jgi:hypothetical protein